MKKLSAAFTRHREKRPSPEEQLRFAGANEQTAKFIALAESGRVDMNAFDAQEGLLCLIAHSGIDAAIWLADNSGRFGIDLNRQDRYQWDVDPRWHTEHLKLQGYLDYQDRLGWQHGPYLRNTALILSVKKGWNHVSNIGSDGRPCSVRELRRKTLMGRATQALLRNGAHPDIQDGCGNTALHIAMLHRDIRPVKALKAIGARNDLRNHAGLLPVDMLDIAYEDINPFLYQQTGNDVNCYIFTLQPRTAWRRAGTALRQEMVTWPSAVYRQSAAVPRPDHP
ncbi:MAG: hypothetical protein HYS17_03095 [Micavibrio aeruginosavorus]|uniref:Ankyrin repeat domain-containing protein n=1 Tax=Micavibrio aeruginosavorus TaxID=349221 RepID=A0A7T5UHT8_9BACT|nr:MAG: hypothetical protein HYS17_03095 [Micavibrio aeruginosavorus]